MGLGPKNLIRIQELCQKGILRPGAQILEFGAQEIYCKDHLYVVRNFNEFFVGSGKSGWNAERLSDEQLDRLAKQGFASEFFRACGFKYRAFDIFDGDSVTLFDLNIQTAPPELAGTIDLVTNYGTTEHLINQNLAMRTMHELASVGGVMHHDLPMGGYHSHGYFSYNPMFFQHLARANEIEVLFEGFSCDKSLQPVPENMAERGWSTDGWFNSSLEVVLRKTSEKRFRMPLETGTSMGLNADVWGGGAPYGNVDMSLSGKEPVRLGDFSGWELQRELVGRYFSRLRRIFGGG